VLEGQQSTARHVSMGWKAPGAAVKTFRYPGFLCRLDPSISQLVSRKLNSAPEKCRSCRGRAEVAQPDPLKEEARESTRLKMVTSDTGLTVS